MTTTTKHDTTGGAAARQNARRWTVLALCCVASAMLGIDASVLNYAVPSLSAQLAPSATQLLWIVDVYGFALGALLIVAGNLGDRIGRKKLLLIGVACFGVASGISAYASTPATLIAARAVLGVAGATIMPSTLSLVRASFTDPKERTTAVGISGGVGAGSFALGPVVGGLLLDHFWWGSVFLVNVPVTAVLLGAGAIVLPESRNPQPGPLDWRGVPLSVVGLFGVIYAIKTGARDGVAEPSVWITAALGAVLLAVFLHRQTALAHPLLDLRLFRNRAFSGAISANVVTMFAASVLSLGFSLYFQVIRGWSPLTAGLAVLPGPLAAAFTAPAAGSLIPLIGRARTVAAGLFLMGVTTAGLGLATPHTAYWQLLPVVVVNGAGLMLIFAVTADTILASAPSTRTGAAAAISETGMELGGALGIAVLGSVLSAYYRSDLRLPSGLTAAQSSTAHESVTSGVETGRHLPGALGRHVTEAARQAFTDSMHTTTLIGGGLLLLGAVAALISLRDVPAVLNGPDPEPVPAPVAG
ncbi:MFS transporter [Actinacidiphila paucisporea]|uniref:MFS transporter, DHA2 family, multidrug resistance protein n=1 Tax=Actinacidiphila paucisporea TaxID=310782 RepID=A0A1M7C6Y8_9ACTN|nr:MFS transporter [Actinacidiphila paucisporea]SHL62943.1 MFS transporter, DHA2 family, multidrug resistance protein [Actinacidiphila paucisporea]